MGFNDETLSKFYNVFGENVVGFKVTLLEGYGIVVEGHKGLNGLTSEQAVIRVGKTLLFVSGENLQVLDINQNELHLGGKITAVNVGEKPNSEKNHGQD